MSMRMTAENREWVQHALRLGENGLDYGYFRDTSWEWIADDDEGIFYLNFLKRNGGRETDYFHDKMSEAAWEETVEYAYDKMHQAIEECLRRCGVSDDE